MQHISYWESLHCTSMLHALSNSVLSFTLTIIPFPCQCNSHWTSCRCIINVSRVWKHTVLLSTDLHLRIINTHHFEININEASPTCFKFSGSKGNGCRRHWWNIPI